MAFMQTRMIFKEPQSREGQSPPYIKDFPLQARLRLHGQLRKVASEIVIKFFLKYRKKKEKPTGK